MAFYGLEEAWLVGWWWVGGSEFGFIPFKMERATTKGCMEIAVGVISSILKQNQPDLICN
jgi:hypothetical protein